MDNRQWRLARKPLAGLPEDADFTFVSEPATEMQPGQALTKTLYLSMDPYQWGRRRSGVEAVNDVCHGRTVSQVIASRHPQYQEGDFVFNTNGWQEYGLVGEGISEFNYMFARKLDVDKAPISTALGVLGMLGLTAYAGIRLLCRPQPGQTVVISAASGGVGQNAGQIAKILGARVVGITGNDEKAEFVKSVLGFDECVVHQQADYQAQLAAACPDGVDAYFENVGGPVFEGVLPLFNDQASIALCGMISQYGEQAQNAGRMHWQAISADLFKQKNIKVHDLFVGNFVQDYQTAFLDEMSDWVKAGKIKYKEDLWSGLEKAPAAFRALFTGQNFGKTIVSVHDDPTLTETIRAHRSGVNILG